MITVLQQFYKALVTTLLAYKHKTTVQEEEVASLSEQLRVMTAEKDMLVEEQDKAINMIDTMTEELNKK